MLTPKDLSDEKDFFSMISGYFFHPPVFFYALKLPWFFFLFELSFTLLSIVLMLEYIVRPALLPDSPDDLYDSFLLKTLFPRLNIPARP